MDALFTALDQLVVSSPVRIDRPAGTAHPRHPAAVYPVDYGYLDGTTAADGEGIDVFVGSHTGIGVTGFVVTVDLVKKDTEVKVLLHCSDLEIDRVADFLIDELGIGATVFRRTCTPG
ncbi:MAG: inorganic pyrophosphatase [Comamonadaceae bacterium]|nr:MAG: inorganic pyrophosphatase [Comamonadaceae bacterium]